MELVDINVRRELQHRTNKIYLRERNRRLEIFIPVRDIGLNEELKLSNSTTVHFKRCPTKTSAVFLLELKDSGSNQKTYLTMHCSLEDTICHVKLAGCFAKGRKLRVQADKISVASNIITCEHIELECNLSMVVESNLECPSISLKSDSDVRLSSSARLKTETLKIIGQTVFIDGHVEYQRHFPNNDEDNLKENCTILNVHINGNLHIGRDGFIRILDAQKLKNEQGTLQLHVEGDICNHGTIEAPNRIEVKNRSLLSCRKCDKDTASRYFSSIKHTHGIDENDDMPPSDMKLYEASKTRDKKRILSMLECGLDPDAPLDNKGRTLTSVAIKRQSETFRPPEKYDNDYKNSKLQNDKCASLVAAWKKQRGSIKSPEISFRMFGDFEDLSQVKECDQIFLDIDGNICVENESICTLGCISGKCKGETRNYGQIKVRSFKSFETSDFSNSGTITIQNGGNISVDNRFHNKSLVYNLNNKLSIYTGVFQQENESQITSQETLEIDICKKSQIVDGSFDARDLYLGISARVSEQAVIKTMNSFTLEFKKNKNTKKYGHLDHKGCIEVDNSDVLIPSTANVYDVKLTNSELVIRGKGEFYNRTGGILQCTRGPLKIQNVRLLENESGASIFGKSIEIATSVVGHTTDTISKNHDLKNNGEISSPGVVKIFAGNMKNLGTIQSHYSQVEIHYTTMKNVITTLEGILLFKECLTVFVHNAPEFHCSFRGGSDLRKSSISLPKKGMWIKCSRGTVFFHNAIEGEAQLLVESKKGFLTLKHVTVTLLCLEITNVYDLTNEENYTDPRLRQEISNGYEVLYDRTNRENHTDLHLHPEIANGHEILCERSETENYTDFRRDKYACINILNGSLLKTEHMIVESNCDTIKIEVRTIGDGEMIVRYDFVCGPELIINGNFTMSSSSLITAAKMITTERSVFKINETTSETRKEMCQLKTSGNIELKGHIYYVHHDRSVPFLLDVESKDGNITVMGMVQVPNLGLLTGPSQKLIIESQMSLGGCVCIGGACKTIIGELSNIECHKLIFSLTSEISERRKIQLDLNGSVLVHGPVILDHIDKIVMFGTLTCQSISAKHADVIMSSSSMTKIFYYEKIVEDKEIPKSYTMLAMNNLLTDLESQIKLYSDNERTIVLLIISTWQHHGCLEVSTVGPRKHKNDVRCQFSNFVNHGKCVNINSLYLHCDSTLSNFSSLSVTDILNITVDGLIINHPGASLESTNGSLTIKTTADVLNNGQLISNDVNHIWASVISNTGVIESYQSTVEIYWSTSEKTSINGIVKSPSEIHFSSPFSKEFHFCCGGGISSEPDRFVMPANRMILKCSGGSVILKTLIEDKQKSANLFVFCRDGCKMHKNVSTSLFCLERAYADEKMLANQRLNIDSHSGTKTLSQEFSLWLKEDCTFVSRKLLVKTGSQNVTFIIRSDDSSKLVCYEQISNLDSLLLIQGNIEISFFAEVRAKSVYLDRDSIVNVFAEEQIDPTFFLYEPGTTDNEECKLLSEMDIEIDGNISAFKDDKKKASIISNFGDVIIKGEVDVPHLQIAAAGDRSIHFLGMVNTRGRLYLSRGRIVNIDEPAVLRCKAFSCEPKTIKSDRLIVNGQLHVMGPAHFVVESIYISRVGQVIIISENSNDHVVIEDVCTVDINGRFECRIQGDCLVDCKRSISLSEKSVCLFSLGECNLIASELIRMDDTCKIELEKGKLYISNAREEDTTIHGSVELSGIICGEKTDTMVEIEGHGVSFRNFRIQDIQTTDLFAAQSLFIDSDSKMSNVEKLEIQATSIYLKGLIKNTPRIKILAESSLLIDTESRIDNDQIETSELYLKITATTIEMKGQIHYSNSKDGKAKMHYDASNMLIMGEIKSEGEIKFEADCSFVNNGQVHCTKIGVVAPICLNCPQHFDKSIVEHISQLGGENQKVLVIEGLLCIIVGSFLHSKSINIKSVLNFQFSAKMSTIPQPGDLDRWKSLVDSSLSKISKANTPEDIQKLTEQTVKIQQVICNLSVSSHLCEDVVKICEKISKGGLGQFDMNEMIASLDNAHSFYSKIIPLELNVDYVRIKYRSVKKRGKKVAKNLINKIFGANSFSKSLEFPQKNLDQGIQIVSFINEGKHTDLRSDGYLSFTSLEFQRTKGLWKNDGYIEACGDIIISASKIKQLGGQGRIIKALKGSIKLTGDSADVKNLESKHLHVDISHAAILQSIKTEEQAVVLGNIVTIQNIDSNSLHVKANENISLDTVCTKGIATLESGNTIDVKKIKVAEINTTSKGNTDFYKLEVDKIDAVSKSGNITLNGKVNAKEAKLEAKHGEISLTGKNKKANHDFGSLTLNPCALKDINKLLTRSDIYKDLKIADHLGLIVEDQNVIIANQLKSQFSLSIKAASIDVRKGIDARNLNLAATKGILKIKKNVKIRAKENVRLTSRGKLQMDKRSFVCAGHTIHLESEKDSVCLSASALDAGGNLKIKANHDIQILSYANGGPCVRSKLTAGRPDRDQSTINLEAKRNIVIHASDIKSHGENTLKAGDDISITPNIFVTVDRERNSSYWGLCKSTTKTFNTHVEMSTMIGRSNDIIAGGKLRVVAAKIKSEFGNNIYASGRIAMLDYLSTETTTKCSSALGINYYQKNQSLQKSNGTSLEDSSPEAVTSITSETSDIVWNGSSLISAGNVLEIAKMGRITHSRRILNHETTEKGINCITQESIAGNGDKSTLFGIEAFQKMVSHQTTSTDSTEIGGSYNVEAKEVHFINSANVAVNGDMHIRADNVKIEGTSLDASNYSQKIGYGFNLDRETIWADFQKYCQTSQQMQNLDVDGTLVLDKVQNATIDTSTVNVGSLKGQADKLDVISRCDRTSEVKLGFEVDLDPATKIPNGCRIDSGIMGNKQINQPTIINVNDESQGLSVGTLVIKGATIVFDGNVHKFPKEIVSKSVHEKSYDLRFGLNIRKQETNMTKLTEKMKQDLGINHKTGQYHSCIASANGRVDSVLAKQVETDPSKRRQVDQSLSFSFSVELEGSISQNIVRIGKDFAKAAGKEALLQISHRLATEFGIPQHIINSLLCIVEGGITQDKLFQFIKTSLDLLGVPHNFTVALQSLLADGNPENLISWICNFANIDKRLAMAIIRIVRGKSISIYDILQIVKHAGKWFGLSEELLQCIAILLSSCGNKMTQQNMWEIVLEFVKSHEGQSIMRNILNAMDISEEIIGFFAVILIEPNNLKKAILCMQAIGQRVSIPKTLLDVLKDMLQGKTPTAFVKTVCNVLSINTNLTEDIELLLNGCCSMKSALISFMTSLSKHIVLSLDMVREIQNIIDGNMPECGMQIFVLNICIQISKSTILLKENPVTKVFEKLLPLAVASTEQLTNAISLGKQILNGAVPSAGIPLLIFLLRHISVGEDIISSIDDFAKKGDVDVLILWMSKKTNIHQSVLGKTLINDYSNKSIFDVILSTYSKEHDLHPAFKKDLELIMNSKPPEHKLKAIWLMYDKMENNTKRLAVLAKCTEIGADEKVASLVWTLLQAGKAEDRICQCFMSIASYYGLPEGFVRGVVELDQKKDFTLLTSWITEVTGTTGELVTFVLQCIVNQTLEYNSLLPAISSIGRMIGLSKNHQPLLDSILQGNISVEDIENLFVQMLFTIIKPHIPALANGLGIPPAILVRLVDLEDSCHPCELFLTVAEIVSAKFALPLDLPRSIQSVIFQGDYKPLSYCLGKQLGVDQGLVLTILKTFQHEKCKKSLLLQIPICIARYYNISEITIGCFQRLLNGKTPKCDTKETIFAIIKDTFRIFMRQELFDFLLQVIERRLGFRKNDLCIVKDLLCTQDPIKIIQLGCMRIGFDEEVVPIVLKIFNCENDLKSVLIEVLGGIGEYFGIYSDLSIDLNKVLTGQKPTRDIPSLLLEIFLQVAKSVQAKPELIESMETLQSLTNISKKQTDSNMILDKLRQFIPILADELAIPSNIIERLVGMRYPFKLSDISFILIEFLAMKAGLSQDIVQAIQVYVFKGETNQLCRWICGQSKIDKTLISSILKSLLNEKTILKGIMKIPVCITQHYDFSTESISILQSLMDGKKLNCDKIQLFLPLIKDGCKLFFDKTTSDIVDTFFAIMETSDWLERVFSLLRYFSAQLEIPEIYIEGFIDLVKNKNVSALVEHLAVKLGINKLVLITLANALTNGGSPKQIFKNLARIAGVPSSAVDIIFEVMKQQGLKSKTGLSPCFTKRIKWPDNTRAITVNA